MKFIDSGNKYTIVNEKSKPIKAWVKGVEIEPGKMIEDEALNQLSNIAKMPFVYKHVAVMPDVHAGKGCSIGSVIPTVGAIVPAAVGVDLGCGMQAVQTTLTASDLPDNLFGIRSAIEKAIPHGRTDNGGKNDRGAWKNPPSVVEAAWMGLESRYKKIYEKHKKIEHHQKLNHLGTLGTGNHFYELCLDENNGVWLMLHSGSRGPGGLIGSYFIELAKKDMRRYFINLPDEDLAYLPEGTEHFNDYVEAVSWAQDFARINREIMMQLAIDAMKNSGLLPPFHVKDMAVNCHHNYITREHHYGQNVWVTRKGAVRARKGDLGIIPGSMGAKSFIVRGKGNEESFHSCSHGAGRKMSRNKAKKTFSIEDHIAATAGVECRKDADVIDETPMAYKDIDQVMSAQSDLVEVVHTLKQLICVKG